MALATAGAPALAAARDLADLRLPDELAAVARQRARVVNADYALIATWGGERLLPRLIGGSAWGMCGCDGVPGQAGFGMGSLGMVAAPMDALVAQIVDGCGVRAAAVTVGLETTRNELVAIDVAVTPRAGGRDEAAVACVAEALWAATPLVPGAPDFKAWRFELTR